MIKDAAQGDQIPEGYFPINIRHRNLLKLTVPENSQCTQHLVQVYYG
jgi:hypothetical protein